jgi:hypothetical protein
VVLIPGIPGVPHDATALWCQERKNFGVRLSADAQIFRFISLQLSINHFKTKMLEEELIWLSYFFDLVTEGEILDTYMNLSVKTRFLKRSIRPYIALGPTYHLMRQQSLTTNPDFLYSESINKKSIGFTLSGGMDIFFLQHFCLAPQFSAHIFSLEKINWADWSEPAVFVFLGADIKYVF